jgi:hypothetical protein
MGTGGAVSRETAFVVNDDHHENLADRDGRAGRTSRTPGITRRATYVASPAYVPPLVCRASRRHGAIVGDNARGSKHGGPHGNHAVPGLGDDRLGAT